MAKKLSVRQTEERVRHLLQPEPAPAPEKKPSQRIYYQEAERQLTAGLGRKVTITPGRKKGKIALEYYDQEDLEALMRALETLAAGREAEH